MTQKRKKKRQTKTEFVLVRMEPDLKTKLIGEAKRRALDPSSLARSLIAEGLYLVKGINDIADRRSRKKKRGR